MRGQLSLEFMVVLAVFLAALAFWVAGVSEASHAINGALGEKQAELAAERAASAINAVCVMGSGNSIETKIAVPGNASVSYNGALVLEWRGEAFEQKVHCKFDSFLVSGKQEITFTNDASFIRTA